MVLTCVASPALAGDAVLSEGPAPSDGSKLSEQELRGRRIYREGLSASGGEILARLAGNDVELPASALTCAGCHGRDGRGRPEGGVDPTDLTWTSLTRPYEVEHPSGRRHGPYTERLLRRAVAMGLDPAGNELGVAMPRYAMSLEDMDDLTAYIQRLGDEPEPGVRDDAVVVGSLLPAAGPSAEAVRARRAALEAYAAELNARGGIYGRRLELRIAEERSGAGALRSLLETGEVFALVGGTIAGSEAAVDGLVLEEGVPLVAPFTLDPQLAEPANPHLFYLYAGLSAQGEALFEAVAPRPDGEGPKSAVLHRGDSLSAALAYELAEEGLARGWPEPARLDLDAMADSAADPRTLVAGLRESGVEALFFATDSGLRQVLEACLGVGWRPTVLAPGALAGAALAAGFEGAGEWEILLAYPTLPTDRDPAALGEYRRLAEKYRLPERHWNAQLESIAALEVLVEGLRRAGRGLTRAGLVAALEQLQEHPTGFTPPVTYGPGRREGTRGAWVLPLSLATTTPTAPPRWIRLGGVR